MPAADSEPNLNDMQSTNAGWFIKEIQNMQFGFGDSPKPLVATTELIEKIVKEQLVLILDLLCETAMTRESSSIGIEDFLFLLRHSPLKLRRFCHYLQVRDMKKALSKENKGNVVRELELTSIDNRTETKDLTHALKFLHHIDPTGYLSSVADPNRDCPLTDDQFKERVSRIDHMTISMDISQYLEYSKARQSSFGRQQTSTKFRDWILHDTPIPDVNTNAKTWDFLSYLAYETVGQIVDLAFIVRRESTAAGPSRDTIERNMAPRQLPFNTNINQLPWSCTLKPLQPKEVEEALLRFNTSNVILAPYTRNIVLSPIRRLLIL